MFNPVQVKHFGSITTSIIPEMRALITLRLRYFSAHQYGIEVEHVNVTRYFVFKQLSA